MPASARCAARPRSFLSRSGARLIEALRLVGGEDAVALGCAFRDIVLDPEMPPSAWPVSYVLEALASEDLDIRCRTAGLRTALGGLLVRIDAAADESAADDDDPLRPGSATWPERTARAGGAGA